MDLMTSDLCFFEVAKADSLFLLFRGREAERTASTHWKKPDLVFFSQPQNFAIGGGEGEKAALKKPPLIGKVSWEVSWELINPPAKLTSNTRGVAKGRARARISDQKTIFAFIFPSRKWKWDGYVDFSTWLHTFGLFMYTLKGGPKAWCLRKKMDFCAALSPAFPLRFRF